MGLGIWNHSVQGFHWLTWGSEGNEGNCIDGSLSSRPVAATPARFYI